MLFTKAEMSKSCFSLTPTYLYVFMFFRKIQSCHDSFLFFCRCCWPSPSYKKGLSTLLLQWWRTFTPWSSSSKCPLFILPNALGYLSFHGNTDFTQNVRFLEISHNFRQMMWDKMGWKRNRNEGQNDIYYLAINEWDWVGYEELSRSRRVLSTEAAVFAMFLFIISPSFSCSSSSWNEWIVRHFFFTTKTTQPRPQVVSVTVP